MQRRDFHYDLPPELIAQEPLPERVDSRLLALSTPKGALQDLKFRDLPSLLDRRDMLVFNNTKVLPARLHCHKPTGGQAEILVERIIEPRLALAHTRSNKPLRAAQRLLTASLDELILVERQENLWQIASPETDWLELLDRCGQVPLPPYIKRSPLAADQERYQTVYAETPGAVAAPTAGLHFDRPLLDALARQGIEQAFVTLHVGAGTFQPVRVDHLDEHQMHAEYAELDAGTVAQIEACKARGGRIVAVGTTSVRALESAARNGQIQPFSGETRLFIRPGYDFQVVDAMVTNFHLPESTLLMLVAAFAGHARVMAAYAHAVAEGYRFFSYGDAMFIAGPMSDYNQLMTRTQA